MSEEIFDFAIIGGGIVGMATAMALTDRDFSVVVLEAEEKLAAHQTGHNSGVIHSGLYYKPGSLKAKNCVEGRKALYEFCEQYDIPHERCGKLVVATDEREIEALDELERRGRANGLEGLKRLTGEELAEYEPHVKGIAGLFVPETGIVDYTAVTETFAKVVEFQGGEIRLKTRFLGLRDVDGEHYSLKTSQGEIACRYLINCAGLASDRVAKLCGVQPDVRIVPFRGEYYDIVPEKQHLVKNLIYPVPDPSFPFLGVHFTRMIEGGVEAGPNAVLAFKREGYRFWDISLKDIFSYVFYGGFWKLVFKFWKMGLAEMYRSLSKRAFVRSLQKLIPEIKMEDVKRGGAGVRAQALDSSGKLVDDFHILEKDRMIHVLNAPSPAATASISIGETIAAMGLDMSNKFLLRQKNSENIEETNAEMGLDSSEKA